MSVPRVGDQAPDFTLAAWADGTECKLTLSEQRRLPLVLAFYPGDDTTVCSRQLCSYSNDLETLDAVVWGISPQDIASHANFAAKRSLRMPLLADVGLHVARLYGVVGPLGLRRSVFVVDEVGRIAWRKVTLVGLTYPTVDDIRAALSMRKS
jgi:peroxiredoxin Q/BCP